MNNVEKTGIAELASATDTWNRAKSELTKAAGETALAKKTLATKEAAEREAEQRLADAETRVKLLAKAL